jgi:hypothetical protein
VYAQQVNDEVIPGQLRARKTIPANELLEANDDERPDTGTQGKTGGDDKKMAALETKGVKQRREKSVAK